MKFLRVSTLMSLSVLFLFLFAACGTASSASTDATPIPTSTAIPTSTPTAAVAASTSVVIKTAMATVQGKTETILTNTQGLTLYYFTPDTATTTACAGSCLTSWPPLLVTAASTPASSTSLAGKLAAVTDPSGMQVQYNGHFLYTFAHDTAAGQTTGQGLGGKWYVATPDLS